MPHLSIDESGAPKAKWSVISYKDFWVKMGWPNYIFYYGCAEDRRIHDVIQVIVDRLTKPMHFLAIRAKSSLESLAYLYDSEIMRLHGVLKTIVFDRDPRVTSSF